MRRRLPRWLAVVLVLAVAGCKAEPRYQLVAVQGKVIYRDQGVAEVTIQLVPDGTRGTHGPTATGQTKKDGSFTLVTPPHGDGVVPGRYKAVILVYSGRPKLPAKYANATETPLLIDVPEGGRGDLVLQLSDK
jgi:hypothetical protein